jgi:HAMP domain-containing protein
MPDTRAIAVLDAHLWALRAEVESQLRRMTDIHRSLTQLSPGGTAKRQTELERLVGDVEALIDANRAIRELSVSVLDEAQALKNRNER